MDVRTLFRALILSACPIIASAHPTYAVEVHPDHTEFHAALAVDFQVAGGAGRPVKMYFEFPNAKARVAAHWRLELISTTGEVLRQWNGQTPLNGRGAKEVLDWDGLDGEGMPLRPGYYTWRMRAAPGYAVLSAALIGKAVDAAQRSADLVEQSIDVQVGAVPKAHMPSFAPLPVGIEQAKSRPAAGGLPFTVYYGNLHSQTNHSDGGAEVSVCGGSERPQAGTVGPAGAYAMMRNQAGGHFLLTSEHNHMYDGSTSENTSASAQAARDLFAAGRTEAANFNSAHSGFVALYGTEWGVINNGGHVNILNPDGLANWENGVGGLIGHHFVAKSDYAALYQLMRNRNWVGQFNHPENSGQFIINGTALAYDANGAEVMALAEVINSRAFSTSTTESETSFPSFISAWNTLLERGYRLAPTSNQDNHCANYGIAASNRTGVLIPNGTAFTVTSFLDAVRARRVFATQDKNAQLILTLNGQLMGGQYNTSGALTLQALYASTSGQTVQRVQFFQGVPGRNGTVTQLAEGSGTHTYTPPNGQHFVYAVVTQADGKRLWSAPIWFTQNTVTDTTPPTVSASVSGSSGTITFNATASDNVGVTRVEFWVDGSNRGQDTTAPYSLSFDSTTLSNGSHTLQARAYDAAGNVGSSSNVSFTVNNTVPDTTPPTVSASVSGSSGTITFNATAADNVGVTRVEFWVDGTNRGQDTTAPYSMLFDSTTLSNGSHTLQARAYDAAGNVGNSSNVAFNVSNTSSTTFYEVEGNGSPAAANVVARSFATIVGTMGNSTDKDFFALSLNPHESLRVVMGGGPAGADYDLFITDASDVALVSSTGSTVNETVNFTNGSSARTVYAKVIAYSGASSTQSYNLALTYTSGSASTQLVQNPSFESGATNWTDPNGTITNNASRPARTGSWKAWMCGYGRTAAESLYQTVTIPSTATEATYTFWTRIDTAETTNTQQFDTLRAQVRSSSGSVLSTLATYSNLNAGSSYVQRSFNLLSYRGQSVRLYFECSEGGTLQTSFVLDDVNLIVR